MKKKKVNYKEYCIEEISRSDKQSFKITSALLKKLCDTSSQLGKKPLLIIELDKNGKSKFKIKCEIKIEKL